jgi:MYXO-CTERM domain-containing protein
MDRRLIPTNRRFVVAIRIRAFSLALFLALACGLPARADSLTTSNGWNWFVSNASGSTSGSPSFPQTFGTDTNITNAANAADATTAPTVAPAPTSQSSTGEANAFINFGAGPYPDANWIASGSPQAWYTSPEVAALFGGTPTAAQQAAFTSTVLQLTEQTFSLSGISVNLTTNPSVPAAHTLSVVSNSSSVPFPSAIGTTELGGSGFSFIDQEAQVSSSVGQLELILAHNIAHELMLAFGVPEKYDQTGNYIDATNANWSMITNPNATFSPAAAQAINQALQSANSTGSDSSLAQYIGPHPAPEPATLVAWGFGLLALAAGPRLRRKRHGAG